MWKTLASALVLLIALTTAAAPKGLVQHKDQGIPGQFIVVLNDKIPADAVGGVAMSLAASYDLRPIEIWRYGLQGFLAQGDDVNLARIARDPRVKYVEQDCTGVIPRDADTFSSSQYTWLNGPNGSEYLWNLDRLDVLSYAQRDGQYNMCTEGRTGIAYIIDRGVYNHYQFENRIIKSLTFANGADGTPDSSNGCEGNPFATHGTWVASVLAGTQLGVAKPQIVSLRIAGCDGTFNTSDYIRAVNWIASPLNTYTSQPGVINHSGFVPVWDSNFQAYGDAVVNVVNSTHIPFFTSSNNYSTDACRFSPANRAYTKIPGEGRVFVVGGTSLGPNGDNNDYRWQEWTPGGEPKIGGDSGSNGGPCISIYAPACSIYLANNSGFTSYESQRRSGTSFAAPAAAGVALRWMIRQQAATGRIPSAIETYDFLLQQAQTPVLNTGTAPTYWMCVQPNATGFGYYTYTSYPSCLPGYLGPYEFPSATNDSDARMLFWNEAAPYSVCP